MSDALRPPALEARQVEFAYRDGVQALTGLSFRANPGELLVVLGANGSGKTTLLKVLARLLTPQAGQVWLGEDPLGTLAAAALYSQVGLVFQNPADQLFADSVADDVAFGPRNLGLNAAEVTARVCAALRDVDAWSLHERPVHQLSFGQQKRVCLACALAMQPKILLLDEPTGGLDPAGEEQMLELLVRLNREQGVTVVVSTHAVDRLPALADRVYVLRAGQVWREGSAGNVFADRQAILEAGLRRPLIAELFEASCVGASPAGQPLPLTVEEGRTQLVRWITQRQGDPR
jgi:cobalt transport protein ATP-binding subunit